MLNLLPRNGLEFFGFEFRADCNAFASRFKKTNVVGAVPDYDIGLFEATGILLTDHAPTATRFALPLESSEDAPPTTTPDSYSSIASASDMQNDADPLTSLRYAIHAHTLVCRAILSVRSRGAG